MSYTNNPEKVRAAKREAYAAAKKFGVTIDYRQQGRNWAADVIAPDGKAFNGDQTALVTAYYTKPDVEFWTMVRMDIENNAPFLEEIDYEANPELDERD